MNPVRKKEESRHSNRRDIYYRFCPISGHCSHIIYLLQTSENLWLGTLFPYYTSCKHQKTFGWEHCSHIIPPANARKPLAGNTVPILYLLQTPENLWLGTRFPYYTSCKHQKTFGWGHCSYIIHPANTRKPLAENIDQKCD